MRAGVVGMGVMGGLHARVYRELGVLSAVCDSNPNALSAVEWPMQVSCFTSFEDLLDFGVDVVSIAVPTQFHLSVVKKCLERGCHVLVEKPMATSLEEAKEIVGLAKETGLVVAVGYIETYNPAFMAVKEIATDQSFGDITSVNIRRVGGLPRSADNVIMDLMTHDIGLLMGLFGKSPDTIHVHKRGIPESGIVNSAQALFSFGQASATCEANWVSPIKIRQIVVTGTAGFCEADLITQTVSMFSGGENPKCWTKLCFNKEPLRAELQAFLANCKLSGSSLIVDAQQGLDVLRVTLDAVSKGVSP